MKQFELTVMNIIRLNIEKLLKPINCIYFRENIEGVVVFFLRFTKRFEAIIEKTDFLKYKLPNIHITNISNAKIIVIYAENLFHYSTNPIYHATIP